MLFIEEDTKVIKGQIIEENHTRIFEKDIKLVLTKIMYYDIINK